MLVCDVLVLFTLQYSSLEFQFADYYIRGRILELPLEQFCFHELCEYFINILWKPTSMTIRMLLQKGSHSILVVKKSQTKLPICDIIRKKSQVCILLSENFPKHTRIVKFTIYNSKVPIQSNLPNRFAIKIDKNLIY